MSEVNVETSFACTMPRVPNKKMNETKSHMLQYVIAKLPNYRIQKDFASFSIVQYIKSTSGHQSLIVF